MSMSTYILLMAICILVVIEVVLIAVTSNMFTRKKSKSDELLDNIISQYKLVLEQYHTMYEAYNNMSDNYKLLLDQYKNIHEAYSKADEIHKLIVKSFKDVGNQYSKVVESLKELDQHYSYIYEEYNQIIDKLEAMDSANEKTGTYYYNDAEFVLANEEIDKTCNDCSANDCPMRIEGTKACLSFEPCIDEEEAADD